MYNYWNNVGSAQKEASASSEHIKTDQTVPGGFYVAEVVDFGAWFKDQTRQWNCKWTFRIIEGAQRGKILVRWSSMNEEQASRNFDLFMHTMGELPPFDRMGGFSDYAAVRAKMQGAVVKLKLEIKANSKTGVKYFNVYVQQSVALGGEHEASAPNKSEIYDESDSRIIPRGHDSGLVDEDEIPF